MLKKSILKITSLLASSLLLSLNLTFLPVNLPLAKATPLNSYNWNNTIPIKTPSSDKNNGKLILFDNSHGETSGQADWVIDGGFSDFADDLVANGYTVKEYRGIDKNGDGCIRYFDDRTPSNEPLNEAVITYDSIKDADVFVIAEANRPFTISERNALKQFVDSGKGIYFISDHYNADRNMNTWDSTEVYNGYNRSTNSAYNIGGLYGDLRNPQSPNSGWLSENFGLRFRFNAINLLNGFSGIKPSDYSEGITEGVQPILMAAGSTLSIVDGNKAKGIVYLSSTDKPSKWGSAADTGLYFGGETEGAYVAISKPSRGKAAFIGDSSPIEDSTTKYKHEGTGANKSTHDGYNSSGNAKVLSINIINWLATSENYIGFDGINHSKGINTPNPMADIEKNETKAEPWATPNYNPWNTDTFAAGAYNAPIGTNASGDISVTSVTLDQNSITLPIGASLSLNAKVLPANATNKSLNWYSSNPAIVSVDNGLITTKAIGTSTITVTTIDGKKTANCLVTVSNVQNETVLQEGFNTLVGSSSSITSGIPTGWIFSSGLAIYNTNSNYGVSSPSLKLQRTGNTVTTPIFSLQNTGTLSFWLKGNSTDSTSHLIIEKFDGTTWSQLIDIMPLPIIGTTKTYSIPQSTVQLKFTYIKSAGNLALDDITIK